MTRRKKIGTGITNERLEFEGKRYRVALHYGRPILVALKCSAGGERLLYPNGRRWKQVLRHMATLR